MSNVERAMEMMHTPIKDLPAIAREYAHEQSRKYGMCMEVLISAYAAYAQIVEGLPCNDPAYDGEHVREWFETRINDNPVYAEVIQ